MTADLDSVPTNCRIPSAWVRPSASASSAPHALFRRVGKAKRAHAAATPDSTPLPGIPHDLAGRIACPVQRQPSALHNPVKAGLRPILHSTHQPVLDRVEMDVIHMTLQIIVVANLMLPVATLPDAFLASG